MEDLSRLLVKELWDILCSDGGDDVRKLLLLRSRLDRRGRVKRLLCRSISLSSVGCFSGVLHFFTGRLYEPLDRSGFFGCIYSLLSDKIGLPDADLNNLSDIYNDCFNSAMSKRLFVDPGIMVFRNGVLDVSAGKFHRRFDKRFVQKWSVDYDYDAGARVFKWHQFLSQVLPDAYMRDVLQMFLGATFIDRSKVKIEHLLILLGSGANGKSVVQQTVIGVLGSDYVSSYEVGQLCSNSLDGKMTVEDMNGKRLNYCTEMEVTDFYRKSARLKAIISGERVSAREMYSKFSFASNLPLLMANANQIPIFNRKDDALVRRIYIIPFNVTIPPERQNKTLGDELVDEYPGILNWILEGRKKFIENGYKLPADVSIDKYIKDETLELSVILKFMQLHGWKSKASGVEMEPIVWKPLVLLYNTYERWCSNNNIPAVSKRAFAFVLENEGNFVRKRFCDGIRFAVYGDIALRKLRKQKKELERERLNRIEQNIKKPNILWVDGTAWVTSVSALSQYSGVSRTVITRLVHEGHFKTYTKAWGNRRIFDVKNCCNVMRVLHIIGNDEEKALHSRILKELQYMRFVFNQFMTYHNLPYRKYQQEEEQIDDSIIVVEDEKTVDEVVKMAKKAGYDVSRISKSPKYKGIFSKGGKGFFDSVDDIPTNEEKKLFKKNKF